MANTNPPLLMLIVLRGLFVETVDPWRSLVEGDEWLYLANSQTNLFIWLR